TPDPRRPAVLACAAFGLQAAFTAVTPYLGGTAPAAAALACMGALNGFGNVLSLTAMQRWAPPSTLGRVMGFVMLGSFGIFPVSVLLGGIVVHTLGPAAFFPIAGATAASAVSVALMFPQWRSFGARQPRDLSTQATPQPTTSTT
ncbi:MAG: hypothetical protein ACYC0H_15340, partial [Solirubrobacteraceae bacterium]